MLSEPCGGPVEVSFEMAWWRGGAQIMVLIFRDGRMDCFMRHGIFICTLKIIYFEKRSKLKIRLELR